MVRHAVPRTVVGLAVLVTFAAPSSLAIRGQRSASIVEAAPVPEPALRAASEVVIRGKKTLEAAIRASMPTSVAGQPPPLVAFVVDVTPNVQKKFEGFRSAISSLGADRTFAREIRVAPLGRRLGEASKSPEELSHDIVGAIRKPTPTVNTMAELAKSLASLREPAVVVYLCDWRFEDDYLVDAFAADLAEKKIVLSVVGTEAAFGRAWTDGSVDPLERGSGRIPGGGEYFKGIGRSPFAKPAVDAPWHGGDSAYPSIPYRYHEFLWRTEFRPPTKSSALADALGGLLGGKRDPNDSGAPRKDDPPDSDPEPPEDLGERLGLRALVDEATRRYPIPSSFGPYGLMRLAAVTGGRYALWSWNPGGRTRVNYDYGRCNLFGPDLRSRERILSEMASTPLAAATILAWNALLSSDPVVEHTPPLERDLKSPQSVDDRHSNADFDIVWDTPSEWKSLQRAIARTSPAVVEARQILALAIAAAKEPSNDLERRRLADARLFEFTLHAVEFELNELDLAIKDVKPELWKKTPKGRVPGVASNEFIVGSANTLAELGVLRHGDENEALDIAAGERLIKARKEHVEKYKGTPFGAQIELADVATYRVTEWEVGKPSSRGGTPSESGGGKSPPPTPTPPPGGGSSGGGGPTTGK